jgi:hypothetical protein
VRDPRSVGARKLGQTIYHLSTQLELAHNEINGLRHKLRQKKKRQKQPKSQLDLQQHQEYHGSAMMWSPRAFREARARIAIAEHKRQEAELKKHEIKELAAANKLYKERIAQEKRKERAREKEERDQAKAQKAAEVAERKAAREAQKRDRDAGKSIQLPNQTKRKASAQLQPKAVKKRGGGGACSRTVAAEPPPPRLTVTTRSGRTATKYC